MSTDDRGARAASFDRGAGVYAAVRPSYPDDAVRWAVPPDAHDVLDLAAGTGKLTDRLVALGLHVIAVEPSDEMRGAADRAAARRRGAAPGPPSTWTCPTRASTP